MRNDEIFGNAIIDPEAFVSSKATIIGDITIGKNVIVAPNADLRADEGAPFFIGKGTNIQDGVVMHGLLNKYVDVSGEQYSIHIGSHCSIAHRALIHGPSAIGKKSFIGFDAIIHYSSVGRNCFIDFKAVIKNASVGCNCHIGIGAIITGVDIASGKYVGDGQIINNQSMADNLPNVPREIEEVDKEFNKEVVDLNKQLVELYKARRKKNQKHD